MLCRNEREGGIVCNGYFKKFTWVVTITRDRDDQSCWTARGVCDHEDKEVYILKNKVLFQHVEAARDDFMSFAQEHNIEKYNFTLL